MGSEFIGIPIGANVAYLSVALAVRISNFMPLPKTENHYPQFSPISLARMCWMHRFGIIGTWMVLTAAVVVFVQRLPPVYTAESLILIDAQKIPERLVPSTVSSDIEDRLAAISQQILSNTRLKKVITDNNLYRQERAKRPLDDVVQIMRSDISVKIERGGATNKPDAFRVGYSGRDPAVVAQVANQLANLFIEENLRAREGQAEGTSEFLSTLVADAKKKLDALETRVREYKASHNGELPEQQNALADALNRLQMAQSSNREAINRVEQSKTTLEDTLRMAQDTLDMLTRPQHAPASSSAQSETSHAVALLGLPPAPKKQSEILEERLATMLDRYGEEYPDVRRLKTELAKAKAAEARAAESRPVVVAGAVPKANASDTPAPPKAPAANPVETAQVAQTRERIRTLKSQIALAQKEIDSRTADQQRMARDFADYEAKLAAVPMREQELAQITRDYEITKVNYHSLLEKQISAEMSTDMERRQKSERFNIIDPAHVPDRPSKPNRLFFDGVGGAFFFCVTVTFFLGLELRRDKLLGEWELPETIPILARVPRISMAGSGGFWSWAHSPVVRAVAIVLAVISVALVAARIYLARGF